jgi:hypothetical protein
MLDQPFIFLIELYLDVTVIISTQKSIWEKRELTDRKKLLLCGERVGPNLKLNRLLPSGLWATAC